MVVEHQKQLSFEIVDTERVIESMRASGYKSTTHALAELIDNSIEANASTIELFGVSRRNAHTGHYTLDDLAVLDNGEGMDATTLRASLIYGYGTRQDRQGIGRFGLGIPNSSMSQADRVDIWSWQTGATNALHTRLSTEDIRAGVKTIPVAALKAIPEVYRKASINGFQDTGTLVVWSELERVDWKRASTTFQHTEALLGRTYRRFLANPTDRLHPDDARGEDIGPQRTITCIPIEDDGHQIKTDEENIVRVKPNDPLYLMSGTSCPEEFGSGPMFKELEGSPFSVQVTFQGRTHKVRLRAAYARPHARLFSHEDATWPIEWNGKDAGHTPWGKHADHNTGVSMVRAHREIDVDNSWVNGTDPRERWWTIEVDFPTALDELFGVTNNKQGTMTFRRMANYDWKREAFPDEHSVGDVRRRMESDGDRRVYLLDLRKQITNAIKLMRPRVQESAKGRGKRHELDEEQKADAKASAAIRRRIQEGHKGESDRAEEKGNEDEHVEIQVKSLVEKHHFDEADAKDRVSQTREDKSRVRWIQSSQSSPAFFDVDSLPGVIQVALNASHPVYSYLYEMFTPASDNMSEKDMRVRFVKARAAFRMLIYAWARYEEEQSNGPKRQVRDARLEWGKYAEEFFDEDDGSVSPTDLI